jgi:hypothetical protein
MKQVCLASVMVLLGTAAFAADQEETPANLAPNASFEDPAAEKEPPTGWAVFATKSPAMTTYRGTAHSGEQCLKFETQKSAKDFQGLLQTLPVEAGAKYTFRAFLTNNKEDPLGGSAYGNLVIEWKNSADREVGRSSSTTWNRSLSRMRWDEVVIRKAIAPKDAVRGVFGIHLNEGDQGGSGSVLVDDAMIIKE